MKAGALRVLGLLRDIVAMPKPVVGSIDGHVRAGGLGLVGACDIVLAGPGVDVRVLRGQARAGAGHDLADDAARGWTRGRPAGTT